MPNQDSQNNNPLNIPKKVVRTYSSDLAESVKEKGGEAYRIARTEETLKQREAKAVARQQRTSFFFGLGGLVLIFASILAIIYFSSKSNVKLNPEPISAPRPIIFFDSQKVIDATGLDKDKVIEAFRRESKEKIPASDIASIIFMENGRAVGSARLASLLELNLPAGMSSYLDQDYFAGILGGEGRNFPFLILRTNSYADISPIIIKWETGMIDDLGEFLGINTAGEDSYLLQAKFGSLIISNKETKSIKGKDGKPVLLYVFLDEKNILIAQNKETLDEVLLRLYSPKK